jgi:DNA adenine methylase
MFAKPILKWVGGKQQIINNIIDNFPKEFNNYREICLGGASVLLALLETKEKGNIKINGNIYAYDINETLIYMYKNIKSNNEGLFLEIKKIIDEFNSCDTKEINRNPKNIDEALLNKENYYYWSRNKFNNLTIEEKKSLLGSALFIFLNKTCFRGLYREGPNGFNVPYGNYKNPEIINKNHLEIISKLIKDVIFECYDYKISLNQTELNDFIYIDPPYIGEMKTSFVNYNKNGFAIKNHIELFDLIHNLTEKNMKVMMNNSDVKLIYDNFENTKYKIESILCKRKINSKNPNAKINEVIITNY